MSFYDQIPSRGVTPFATPTVNGPIGFGEVVPVTATYTSADRSFRTIYVVADSQDNISESNKTNNEVHALLGGLETPQDLAVTPAPGGLRLRWTYPATPDSMEFWIWRVPSGGGLAQLIGATTNQTFLDSTAVPGQAYTYQLTAFDPQGVRSLAATSTPVAAARSEPVAPESLRLAALTFQGALSLSWPAQPPAHLESAPELAGTATRWTALSQGVTQIGGIEQLTLPAVQNQQFFRLVSP